MTTPVQQGMTVQQYAAAQAAITEALASVVAQFATLFRASGLTESDWSNLLSLLYPYVQEAREGSSRLGRQWFDTNHRIYHPEVPPPDALLVGYKPQWFVEEMFPAKKEFMKPGASDHATSQVVLRAMKAVENGGRRQVVRGAETELAHERKTVGWARVATGRETCAFCLMLVSRGPVYMSASSAGLDLDDTSAKQLFDEVGQQLGNSSAELDALMTRWHAGCDCKVVPVFDKQNWPGREAQKRSLKIWKETTRGYSGKDAMNAFRRAIERGDVDINAMSIAA